MNDLTQIDTLTGEVLPPATGLYAAVAAQIDKQISTARAFPRTMARVGNTLSIILSDEKIAESAVYSLKRGGRTIQGPSSRFAELVAYAYGHLRVDARLVEEGKDFIIVRGEAHDLQTNTSFAQDVTRRIVDSRGKRYDVDLISMTFMAAASIAQRDSILKVVPSHVWRPAFDAALQRITGDVKTLADRRVKAIGQFSVLGVTADQVFKRLGVANINDVTADHLVDLVGTFQAIKAGDTTVEAEFGDARITTRGLGSPLAAREDEEAVEARPPNHVPDRTPEPMGNGQPEAAPAPQDQVAKHPLTPQIKEVARAMAGSKARTTTDTQSPDQLLDTYERECVAAKTPKDLTAVALRWGASGLVDGLTPSQKIRFDDVYEASMRALKLLIEAQDSAKAKQAYEAARNGQDGDSRPVAHPQPPPQKAAVEAPAGSGEHIFYEKLHDVRPSNPEVLAIWKECVDHLLGAKNAGDVIARYNDLEQKGKVAAIEKLSEQDALQLRTVRLRIKQAKAAA